MANSSENQGTEMKSTDGITDFYGWLESQGKTVDEVCSCTGSVATFARPIMGLVRRQSVPAITDETDKKKKRKKKD